MTTQEPIRAVGYARVSTADQAEHGYSLGAQERELTEACRTRGWELLCVKHDAASGRSANRPGLERVLALIDSGEASTLVVTKLDRLSRSTLDFAGLVQRAEHEGWNIVVLNLGIDLNTPNGKLAAGILVQVAQFEREILAERIREGIAEKRARGEQVGSQSNIPRDIQQLVGKMRWEERLTYKRMAEELNRLKVVTSRHGKRWYPSTARFAVKIAARYEATKAEQNGVLVRPERCEECEMRGPHVAHHESYDKPLDVVFLCTTCHEKRHPERGPGRRKRHRNTPWEAPGVKIISYEAEKEWLAIKNSGPAQPSY